MRKRRICNLLPTITNLLSLARFATPKNIGEPLDLWFSNVFMGYVDVFMFSGEAGGGGNFTSNDTDMKLGPVNKLGKRNKMTSK